MVRFYFKRIKSIMLKEKYLQQIKHTIDQFAAGKNLQVFIFGSGLTKDHFGDIDLGLMGKVKRDDIYKLKEEFEESAFPYSVDVVDFNKVSDKFKNNVLENKVLWIKR